MRGRDRPSALLPQHDKHSMYQSGEFGTYNRAGKDIRPRPDFADAQDESTS